VNNNFYFQTDRTALLKVVGGNTGGTPATMDCNYLEFRGRMFSIDAPAPVASGSAVSVELEDALYLGEVIISCERNGRWLLEIQVEQILSGLNSLVALRKSLMCEAPATQLATALSGRA
jgi:hypothetical protein